MWLVALPVEFHRCMHFREDFEVEAALILERCLVPQNVKSTSSVLVLADLVNANGLDASRDGEH